MLLELPARRETCTKSHHVAHNIDLIQFYGGDEGIRTLETVSRLLP